jgi:tripartite-type tricarboxylate transporter receptor subunit TctC
VLATPAVSEKLAASGAVPMASTPQELTLLLQQDTVKWGKLIRDKKIIAE